MSDSGAILERLTVQTLTDRQRLGDYLVGRLESIPSRKGIKKAIQRGEVLVDGKRARSGHWVKTGEVITIQENTQRIPKPYQLGLHIAFEDEHLAVVVKPAGIPTSGNAFRTLENALLHNLEPATGKDAYAWPRPVHRLDGLTTGLVIVAKRSLARVRLGQQLEERSISKTYQAIVLGQPPEEGTIDTQLDGKPAVTEFERLRWVRDLKAEYLSLLRLSPITGRTHQLRRHLAETGFPILGDATYGASGLIFRGKGLFLAATELRFRHPITGEEMELTMEAPSKFERHLERAERRWSKFNPSQ